MSVIVKGMEMPKNCKDCPFSDHEAWCLIPGDTKERYYCPKNKVSEHCPLVELPEKHGRLINADFVIEKASHEAKAMDEPFKSNFDVLVEWIVDKTPTVIEAEGSE